MIEIERVLEIDRVIEIDIDTNTDIDMERLLRDHWDQESWVPTVEEIMDLASTGGATASGCGLRRLTTINNAIAGFTMWPRVHIPTDSGNWSLIGVAQSQGYVQDHPGPVWCITRGPKDPSPSVDG